MPPESVHDEFGVCQYNSHAPLHPRRPHTYRSGDGQSNTRRGGWADWSSARPGRVQRNASRAGPHPPRGLRRRRTAAVEQGQAAEGHERQRGRLGDHGDPRLLLDRRVPAPADERPAVGQKERPCGGVAPDGLYLLDSPQRGSAAAACPPWAGRRPAQLSHTIITRSTAGSKALPMQFAQWSR